MDDWAGAIAEKGNCYAASNSWTWSALSEEITQVAESGLRTHRRLLECIAAAMRTPAKAALKRHHAEAPRNWPGEALETTNVSPALQMMTRLVLGLVARRSRLNGLAVPVTSATANRFKLGIRRGATLCRPIARANSVAQKSVAQKSVAGVRRRG